MSHSKTADRILRNVRKLALASGRGVGFIKVTDTVSVTYVAPSDEYDVGTPAVSIAKGARRVVRAAVIAALSTVAKQSASV